MVTFGYFYFYCRLVNGLFSVPVLLAVIGYMVVRGYTRAGEGETGNRKKVVESNNYEEIVIF